MRFQVPLEDERESVLKPVSGEVGRTIQDASPEDLLLFLIALNRQTLDSKPNTDTLKP